MARQAGELLKGQSRGDGSMMAITATGQDYLADIIPANEF
jgi:hypothetical protein